jgi:CRISPR/Cas system-associated exonuclease Cas4 (RecB family)
MEAEDVGGVHIKYLHHCRRQLWLYARGVRPEHLNAAVQLGEAVHDTLVVFGVRIFGNLAAIRRRLFRA